MGWINAIAATPIVDKEQTVQQMQAHINQAHIEAQTLHDQSRRQTTVTHTPDSERVRMRQRREEKRHKKRRRQQGNENEEKDTEGSEAEGKDTRKRINVTV